MKNDMFIDIAASGIGGRTELLYEPAPAVYKKKKCVLKNEGKAPIKTEKKIDSQAELMEELAKMRKAYAPFLENHAPEMKEYKSRIDIRDFVLDGKEKITIPHYGGPVGYAVKVYEAEFNVEKLPDENSVAYICFKGVDYIAEVHVNGEFAGSHEGFFSPFEFEITDFLVEGKNSLKVKVKNDYRFNGDTNGPTGEFLEGDKLYAATGLGWDDSQLGWHHCPAGMGIYNDVYVEFRSKTHIHDLFIRPDIENKCVEAWIDINNCEYKVKDVEFLISIYGQNFKSTIVEKKKFTPSTMHTVGMGDSLSEAEVKDILGKMVAAPAHKGINLYKFTIDISDLKLWELESPYLYQAQVELIYNGEVTDSAKCQFGMREFKQDLDTKPYGMFYLNGKKIRLRGANTMGFEQQDVLRGDFDQLIDDILLAKLCNMNYLRLTQRPVQREVYEYCDRLGLMTQTDLPIFGCVRRPKTCEAIRQAEEMERFIRNHACNVIISYINEPFPNGKNAPHRHLTRPEMEDFFTSCDNIVRLNNPDRVIKHVDGDYDPPTEGMPDNHCYPTWYNGHGIDIGKLHRGYWMNVKPDWYYGSGEYGTEGLECVETMKKYYPEDWTTEPFDPKKILFAQTAGLHYFFYDSQEDIHSWAEKSQEYQAFATTMMTEAYRRNSKMISNAIHLFIDAWPSGWMKTIMDCDRNAKKAYFAYRNALEPMLVSIRTDRFTYTSGEDVSIETLICNDTNKVQKLVMNYEVYDGDTLILSGKTPTETKDCDVSYVSDICFTAPEVSDRKKLTIKAILTDESNNVVSYNTLDIEVFAPVEVRENDNVIFIGPLDPGVYEIAGEKVAVTECGMMPLHFASRKTGHEIVAEFKEKDFSYWYNENEDMITPLLYATFTAEGFTPVITSGNKNEEGDWDRVLALAVKKYDGKLYIINQLDMRMENPVAQRLMKNIYEYAEKI